MVKNVNVKSMPFFGVVYNANWHTRMRHTYNGPKFHSKQFQEFVEQTELDMLTLKSTSINAVIPYTSELFLGRKLRNINTTHQIASN